MTDSIGQLRERMAALMDLRTINQLLEWDQQTMMPPRGVQTRAESLATLQRIRHEMFVSDEVGRLLDAADAELNGQGPDSDDAALVRVTRRRWEKARRVPSELAAELARASSVGQKEWVAARADSDFASFVPNLERNYELARRYVDCFDGFECAYDVLLDDYEPGMKTTEVAGLFSELKSELTPMIAAIAAACRPGRRLGPARLVSDRPAAPAHARGDRADGLRPRGMANRRCRASVRQRAGHLRT